MQDQGRKVVYPSPTSPSSVVGQDDLGISGESQNCICFMPTDAAQGEPKDSVTSSGSILLIYGLQPISKPEGIFWEEIRWKIHALVPGPR